MTTNTTQQKSVIAIRVQPSNCPFSVILFQIHERWASLDAEAIPLLLNGVALGVVSRQAAEDRSEIDLTRYRRSAYGLTPAPGVSPRDGCRQSPAGCDTRF